MGVVEGGGNFRYHLGCRRQAHLSRYQIKAGSANLIDMLISKGDDNKALVIAYPGAWLKK